jgi:hypothetical protein
MPAKTAEQLDNNVLKYKKYNVFGASSTENSFVNGGIAQIGELYTNLKNSQGKDKENHYRVSGFICDKKSY